jgi:hypothetical protein
MESEPEVKPIPSNQDNGDGDDRAGDGVISAPYFLFTNQNYILDWDENGNPVMRFDTNRIDSTITVPLLYTPGPGQGYFNLTLYNDGTASPIAYGPQTLFEYYLSSNLQTDRYEIMGSNLDNYEAYDWKFEVTRIISRNTRFTWNKLKNTSYYTLAPNASSLIPVSPASK